MTTLKLLRKVQVHPVLLVLLALQVLDLASTGAVLRSGGVETNQLVLAAGWHATILVKLGVLVLMAVAWPFMDPHAARRAVAAVTAVSVVYGAVVANNLYHLGAAHV